MSLKSQVGELATALAGKILGSELQDTDVQSDMLDNMIGDLDKKTGNGQ